MGILQITEESSLLTIGQTCVIRGVGCSGIGHGYHEAYDAIRNKYGVPSVSLIRDACMEGFSSRGTVRGCDIYIYIRCRGCTIQVVPGSIYLHITLYIRK